jgi:transcriptional regulator with XRE-family HTH domain
MPEPIIGERLRTLRQRQGISQADLARALGASINAINMIECGQVKAPHIARLMAMADLFDVSLDYLVGMTDDPAPPRRPRPRKERDA